MTRQASNYAKALYELVSDRQTVDLLKELFMKVPQLTKVLADPMISLEKKHRVIDAVSESSGFSPVTINFIKYVCDHRDIGLLSEIASSYDALWDEKHNILNVELLYAEPPKENELEDVMKFLEKRYPGKEIHPSTIVDEDLLGGLCIRVGHEEFDWSYEGRLKQLERKLTVR